jgi:hypothetical protein
LPILGGSSSHFTAATGTFTATGGGQAIPVRQDDLNLSLWGTFSASITLERSFDNGTTWLPCTYIDGSPLVWTGPMSTGFAESESGTQYRFNCTSYSSGTVNYRISQ